MSIGYFQKSVKKILKYNTLEKASNQLTLALLIWSCYVKNPQEEINQLRDEPLRQRHVVQEHAAHKQTLHSVLERQDVALEGMGSVEGATHGSLVSRVP